MSAPAPQVSVVGSLHYDVMIEGATLPRQGETAVGRSWRPKCGGKGANQAIAAAQAGAAVAMIGCVGADEPGRIMIDNLAAHRVDHTHVRAVGGLSSGMSVALADDDGDYRAVIVSGANLSLSPDDVLAAEALLARTALLIVQNEVPAEASRAAASLVRNAGGRVIFNAAPARAWSRTLCATTDLLVVNAIEAGDLLALSAAPASLDEALRAADRLAGEWKAAVVTAGGAGLAYADRDGTRLSVPAVGVPVVVSTHGAGDCFVGTLAARLALGAPISAALEAASEMAARHVSSPEADRA